MSTRNCFTVDIPKDDEDMQELETLYKVKAAISKKKKALKERDWSDKHPDLVNIVNDYRSRRDATQKEPKQKEPKQKEPVKQEPKQEPVKQEPKQEPVKQKEAAFAKAITKAPSIPVIKTTVPNSLGKWF